MRSHNHHLQSGMLTETSDPRFRGLATPIFYTKPGPCEGQPRSPWMEAQNAIAKIYEDQTEDISLCLSGGVDSECMLRAFHAAKRPFRTFIFRYLARFPWSRPWNHHDIQDAFKLCQELGIQPEVLDLKALDYFESGKVLADSIEFECGSPQLCLHIDFLRRVPGCPVLAWNAPNFEGRGQTLFPGMGLPGHLHFSYFRYFDKQKRAGIPFFFLYTPELFNSFFSLPSFQKQRSNPTSQGTYALKCDLYREGGFAIENRQDKFTGFEVIRQYYDRKSGKSDEFNRRFRYPLMEKLRSDMRLPQSEISLVQGDFFD